MHRGYIKIWRKIEDSFLMNDPDAIWLWIRLLLKANHKPTEFMFNSKIMTLNRGQVLTGRKSLVDKHKISESKVYRLLKTFENEHLIEQQKTNLYSIITIVCYDQYQSSEQLSEQPVNNKRTTSEQPVNTYNTLKNDKNIIIPADKQELMNQKKENFDYAWNLYPRKIGRKDALKHFMAQVNSEEEWNCLLKGIESYKSDIERLGTKEQYVKHGSSFFNNVWRDWGTKEDV